MGKKIEKTNAIRILDAKNAKYKSHTYDTDVINAVEVAEFLGKDPAMLFKTLVTVGRSGTHYVFMVPGAAELDLKKAAAISGEKSLEMIPQRELLPLTGYVHGGCSPIGMKKQFATFIDITAESFETICFSGGRIGIQAEMALSELRKVIRVISADITKDL